MKEETGKMKEETGKEQTAKRTNLNRKKIGKGEEGGTK